MSEVSEYKCIACGLLPKEQEAKRLPRYEGLCGPGRCVVRGTVWLVQPDGQPLGFVTKVEQELADALHRARLGHLSPIDPRPDTKGE